MIYSYNKKLVSNARALRNNMTDEENHLWYDFLKKLPLTVNRQKNIGNYILDFFIDSKRLHPVTLFESMKFCQSLIYYQLPIN